MSEYGDKLRAKRIGYLSRGRTRPQVTEGRAHPDSGKPFKAVKDENGHVVTEHGTPGTGLSDRQDVHLYPQTVTGVIEVSRDQMKELEHASRYRRGVS